MLKINFCKVGSGAQKIERGEFAIQETSTKRQIDLNGDWETVFLPGQRVDMSMIFRKNMADHSVCPGCSTIISGVEEDRIVDCLECGMAYSHHVEKDNRAGPSTSRPSITNMSEPNSQIRRTRPSQRQIGPNILKRKRGYEADDEMRLYRRVRIIDEAKDLLKDAGELPLFVGDEVAYYLPAHGGEWKQGNVFGVPHDKQRKRYNVSTNPVLMFAWLTCRLDTQ